MLRRAVLAGLMVMVSFSAWAVAPYISGDRVQAGPIGAVAAEVQKKLTAAGFQVLGVYSPHGLPTRGVVVATDAAMLAKIREFGGPAIVAAPIRVGISSEGAVSYTNPDYWYRAYLRQHYGQAETAARAVQSKLAQTLGAGPGFGGDESTASLPGYRYIVGMERFDDKKNLLAKHASFDAAVKTVQDNLARGLAGTSKAYELVMPDKKLALFGVAMNSPANGDATIIKKIGVEERIAGFPYEMFVVNSEVHALYGRYRLALAFPDLSMGHFTRIVYAPGEILETLKTVAGGD